MKIGSEVIFNEIMEGGKIREMKGIIVALNANSCTIEYKFWPPECDDIMTFKTTKSINDVREA